MTYLKTLVSNSEYVQWNDMIINEQLIAKGKERSGCGLICDIIPAFAWWD
jgi:hypothetical protein